MSFHVGQKVVRFRSNGKTPINYWCSRSKLGSKPALNEVVTIKTINEWSTGTLLTFREHDNSHLTENGFEPGFNAACFRPVTDISIFTAMLNTKRRRVEA